MSNPEPEDAATRQQRLAEEWEAELEALIHDTSTLPAIPTDVHLFGSTIEFVKNMLARMNSQIGLLKEQAAAVKDHYAKDVRGDKAALNDKDKGEVARLCSEDPFLASIETRSAALSAAWVRWDARRSRLNRDFEVALVDYRHGRRLFELQRESEFVKQP